ncbi:MAG TPA: AarF/ABC1/UbiB kinase family protein [Acidimicrobiales bacterium]|nr:AarF/ABC1/UbiB kinase family protein [Acidimicrobiales bacterium]
MTLGRQRGGSTSSGSTSRAPTPLLAPEESTPIEIRPLQEVGRFAVLRLFLRIVVFGAGMATRRLLRRATPADTALRTREFLEDLGGLWIKAGQLISLREDLLSHEMATQLSQLSHRAHGFAPEIARKVLEDSIGSPVETEFAYYEEHPFAAASISQVHRARRRSDGVLVAIKIQRPGITKTLERDVKLIGILTQLVRRMPRVSHMDWDETMREIRRIALEEVDYRYELSNLYEIRKKLKKHKVDVPKVDRRLSNDRVIVMEYVDGVLMSHLMQVLQTDPERARRWCAENNIEMEKVGKRLLNSFYRQLFEDNLFHGDLHPGNIMLLRDSRFALIDLGTVGSVEQKLMEYYRLMSQSFNQGNYAKAIDYFLLQTETVPVMDVASFKKEATEIFRAWERRSSLLGLSYYEKAITGGVAVEFANLAQRYKIGSANQFLRVSRSLATMDANLGILLGDTNPNKIMKKYFEGARRRELRRIRKEAPQKVGAALYEGRMTLGFASETLRQNAIKVHGIHRKIDSMVKSTMGILRLVLIGLLVVITYDWIAHHHPDKLDRIIGKVHFLESVAERIPAYHQEWALILMAFLIYMIRQTSRVRRQYAKPAATLPNGRVATGI